MLFNSTIKFIHEWVYKQGSWELNIIMDTKKLIIGGAIALGVVLFAGAGYYCFKKFKCCCKVTR